MDFDETPQDAAFRAEAIQWLDAHRSDSVAQQARRQPGEDDAEFVKRARAWQALMAEHRWAAVTWPESYGGRGATAAQAAIFNEEAAKRSLPARPFVVGTGMAGPTIIDHGTDEQQARFLAPMLQGDEVWCQLFSEPGAGSDLAGLATRAVRDGDEWVIDGQKVWTSGADYSDYGMLLARTDSDVPKHRGITYFLIDMRQPGIEVRPLRQMTGSAHFSEVFFSGARVPHDAVLGEVGAGWSVAMTTLANERTFMGGHSSGPGVNDLLELARASGVAADPIVRQRLAAAYTRSRLMEFLGMQVRTAASKGQPPGPGASVLKVMASSNLRQNADLALEIQGAGGMLAGVTAPEEGRWQQLFLSAPSIRIAGGSDEIQRNIMGERVLGLPPEPRLDKTIAFRDVPTSTARP